MASIYQNGNLLWLKLRHPVDGIVRRVSLQTSDRSKADILRRKWEAYCQLFQPEFLVVEFPNPLQELLPPLPVPSSALPTPLTPSPVTVAAPVVVQTATRKPFAELLMEYYRKCESENDSHHVAGKASIIRKAFGEESLEKGKLDGPLAVECIEDLTCARVEAFIESYRKPNGKPLARTTKRHHRELFVHLFNFALRREYLVPRNFAFPNLMTALPSWSETSREIVFLEPEQIAQQLKVLEPHPVLHMAVSIMIFAGPRRSEALWLERKSVREANNERYLSIRKISDESSEQSLKTTGSSRPVTILPELAKILDQYLATAKSTWLLPSPQGRRWDKDHFSQALAEVNKRHKLTWSCMHYRHTYATLRAAAGVSVFALAKEMGSSVSMITKHYAALFNPSALR